MARVLWARRAPLKARRAQVSRVGTSLLSRYAWISWEDLRRIRDSRDVGSAIRPPKMQSFHLGDMAPPKPGHGKSMLRSPLIHRGKPEGRDIRQYEPVPSRTEAVMFQVLSEQNLLKSSCLSTVSDRVGLQWKSLSMPVKCC